MPTKLTASTVLDVAIQIERNGLAFYGRAAEYAKAEAFQKELRGLAKMEQDHAATFTTLKQELLGNETDADWFDPDTEMAQYLATFTEGYVFNVAADASQALTELPTLEDILSFAVEREQDAILFYVGLKEMLPKTAAADSIEHIIQQEMGHVVLLNRKIKALSSTEGG